MHSQPITLEGSTNTRDLGGLETRDGKIIQSKRLIRSSCPYTMTAHDFEILARDYHVHTVVDLRDTGEKEEKPLKLPESFSSVEVPIFSDEVLGITRSKRGKLKIFLSVLTKKEDPNEYFTNVYRDALCSPHSAFQYCRFFELLLQNKEGAILWNCSAGKDRAGLAAALLEKMLGVDWDTILEDYLATNEYNKTLNEQDKQAVLNTLPRFMRKALDSTLDVLYSCKEKFLLGAWEAVEKQFGSFDNYFETALHMNKEKQELLKSMYLE